MFFYIRLYILYVVHSVHYRQLIHDIKQTKCRNLFLIYLYYNITLYIAMCFGPQRTIIRESNKHNAYLLTYLLTYFLHGAESFLRS